MKKSILVTAPNHDLPTSCLHFFAKKLFSEIDAVGEYNLLFLEREKANKNNFESYIIKHNPRLIVLNGHGSKKAVCGHNDEIILENENISLIDSKIVYAIACDSSEELGELAIKEGKADAYVGYEANFMIIADPIRSTTLSKDKNLKVFIKPYASLFLSLVSGLSVGQAINRTKNTLKDLIREYGVYDIKDKYGDAPLIRFALYWDLTFLKGYGDLTAVV